MRKSFEPKIVYRLREIPIKDIKIWKDAQARRLDREGISELAKSIRSEGLQNPPLVQKFGPGNYLLLAGQRRLAAMKRLRAKTMPVHIITKNTQYDLNDAKAASVIENIHRRGMSQRDLADSCVFFADHLKSQHKAAKTLGMSLATFKKLHGFAGVPQKIKDLVPGTISRDEATGLHVAVPQTEKALDIAKKISRYNPSLRRQYVKVLAKNPKMPHADILKTARRLQARQKFTVTLSKRHSAFLSKAAERRGLEPKDLANKLVHDWIKKRI